MKWAFTGDGGYHNPGDTVAWYYTEDKIFTGQWCENCGFVANGSCELGNDFAGSCQYTCSCEPGYILDGGVCTAHPVCKPDSSLTVTYQPNGGVNARTGITDEPEIQNVTYMGTFVTKDGTIFTKTNNIITAWDTVSGGAYPELNHWYQYNTAGDTVLAAHWEPCTCTPGNGVTSCETSATDQNACNCTGECATRYINGGCSCNGTTCTQSCTECPAGYISNDDQSDCDICPAGTYQLGITCVNCPDGYTSPAGSTSIEACYDNPVSYTVHYLSNNGLDQTETWPVAYGATFTTLGGTTFAYDNHMMTRWERISGGNYTELSHPYEYNVQEDTYLKAQWAQCECSQGGDGVASCTTSSTNVNSCSCTGECAPGFVNGGCTCDENTCTQTCTKCADNQVEINGVCVDCSCSADGDGVVSGCGFVSNENNVCHWGPTTCNTGYSDGTLSCTDSTHNNNCTATCSQDVYHAIYNCGTGTGIQPVTDNAYYNQPYTIQDNAVFYGCQRENSTFAGWEFDGDQRVHAAGETVTWNYTTDKNFRAVYCNKCLPEDHCTLDIPNPGECVVTCHTGYEWDSNLKKCVAKTYPGDEGITYKPNGGTPNQNYTQTVTYDASFTTLGWSTEHYRKPHHIMTQWVVESGGAGTFDGSYADLGTEYTYKTDGATVLAADWQECAADEISLNNLCQQCNCTSSTDGVTSCTTSATNDDTCSCSGECAAGYISSGCVCDGTTCTQSCSKCEDNQVSVHNTCVDCRCNILGDGVFFGCGFVSNNGNVCNWKTTTCELGYGYPDFTCRETEHNNNCSAKCTICPAGTYGNDGLTCKDCPVGKTSLPGATSIKECFTDPNSCAQDEHIEHGECVSNTRACSIPNATSAARIWNPAIGTYGPCTVIECDEANGYHESGNACVRNTCTVAHGSAESEYVGGQWECFVTRCDPGYEPSSDSKSCVECANRYVDGDLAVSSYVSECEIAACMYQGQKYALEEQFGEKVCVPICTMDRFTREDPNNPTGTIRWDDTAKKCIRTCKPGYKMW